jgi:hypothetical protein
MVYKTMSAAVYGIDASIIEVEVDVSGIKTNEDYFHTVSESGVNAVRNYTQTSKSIIRKRLFQDEFLAFLKEERNHS